MSYLPLSDYDQWKCTPPDYEEETNEDEEDDDL